MTDDRLIATVAVVGVAVVVALLAGPLARRRSDDATSRFYLRRLIRSAMWVLVPVVLLLVWQPFGGRASVVIGLTAAGLAFAMQEVVGAVAGWFNILTGRIYRVGDRVAVGDVHGDVIDIALLRTRILEMGAGKHASGGATDTSVQGRQHTGRVVTISNKATFTSPVFNYSEPFGYLWEELAIVVPHAADWRRAERLLLEEAVRVSNSEGASAAIERMAERYPIPRAEIEPRVFVQITDDWLELSARFVVPVRSARTIRSDLARRLLERLDDAGIPIASRTFDVSVRRAERTERAAAR